MQSEFYSAVIPEPTTILGIRLRPLSLGHLVILHRLRSSFVTPDEPFTLHDLALSVLVCSMSYKDGLKLFEKRSMESVFRLWHWKLNGGLLAWLGLRKPAVIDYEHKATAFVEYLRRHCQSPYYSYEPSKAEPIHCPEVQLVRVALMRALRITDEEIMDRPWALCLWDNITLKALDGNVKMPDREAIMEAQATANRLAEQLKAN